MARKTLCPTLSSTITCAHPAAAARSDGSLHEVTALNLASQALGAIKSRNDLDTTLVDDVVMGVVDPVGEAGADIARTAALVAGYGDSVAGVQINRFCASGLDAVNFAAAQIMSGQQDMAIGGGVESMSRVGIGASGGAWAVDPTIAVAHLLHAARHFRRSHRHQIRLFARRRRRLCGREPEARGDRLERRPLQPIGHESKGRKRAHHPRQRRAHAARRDHAVARLAQALLRADGRNGRLRRGRHSEASGNRIRQSRPSCRQFLGHRRRRRSGSARQQHARARRRI